jgi:PAS domain S-box-containing protein
MKKRDFEEAKQNINDEWRKVNFEEALPANLLEAEDVLTALASVFFPPDDATRAATQEWFNESIHTTSKEKELPDVKDRYRILVDQIPAVVFMAYLDRGIGEAYVSPQIEAMLGFTQEEWLNDPVRWYQHIHPKDKSRWNVEAAQMFLLGKPLKSVYRVIARDGRVIWFQCEAKMVRSEDGRPWFIHGAAFDITELKQTEEALRESEQMLRGLFEFAPDTVVVINHQGYIERVNTQVERMFGYKRDELLGQPIEVLLPDRFRQKHAQHRDGYLAEPHTRPMGAGLELFSRRKDGSEFPVDIMLSPMEAPEGCMVIAVIRDITNRKQAEAALKRREEELRALTANLLSVQDKERRRIARDLHDGTAQNLAGLAMNLSLLMNTTTSLPDPNFHRILSDSLALAELCSREIRNLSYLLHPPLLDDLGLASALKSYILGFSQRTHIQVELELPPNLRRLAPEVETALFRIVQEGLANVHRHSGSSSASIRIEITDIEVKLAVEDKGSKSSAGSEDNGAKVIRFGVGIPGMRERAQQLGGRMEINSSGNGTKVTVTLPLENNL